MMIYNAPTQPNVGAANFAPRQSSAAQPQPSAPNAKLHGPAAVFEKSKLEDYDEKKLNPLQKSIMNLQEQISKAKSNEHLSPREKTDLIESLNEQLKTLEDELTKQTAGETEQDRNSTDRQEKNAADAANEQPPAGAVSKETGDTLLAASANINQLQATSQNLSELETKLRQAQNSIENGIGGGWLGDADTDVLSRRQADVNKLKDAVENAQKDLGDAIEKANQNQSDAPSAAARKPNPADGETAPDNLRTPNAEDEQSEQEDSAAPDSAADSLPQNDAVK